MIEDNSPLDKMTQEEMNSLVQSIKNWVKPLLELVAPHVKQLSWINLNLSSREFRYRACLISATHFAPNSFKVDIEPWNEDVYEYLDRLEEHALSDLAEISNWSKAA